MTKKSGIGIIRRIVNHNLKISKQATIWWIKFIEKFRTLELDEAAGSIDILLANQTECEYNSTFPPPSSSAIKKSCLTTINLSYVGKRRSQSFYTRF